MHSIRTSEAVMAETGAEAIVLPASAETPAETRDASKASPNSKASPHQVLGIVCVGICLANLDLFIVNVGIPSIGRDFADASLEDLSWILSGYAIAYAALLVFSQSLRQRHRRALRLILGIRRFTAS